MTDVYRLVRADRADDVLSGEGARLYGGRWNPRGAAVVYGADSRALAVLETFVHLTLEARTMRFVLFALRLPPRPRIERIAPTGRPRSLSASTKIGADWFEAGTSLALVVPSVIVPQESNYVLNVRHAQFAQVRVAKREAFSFDERLWQRR